MKYRKEIDGLRAVAVIPVILFHAGFEQFSGGFVGVDVFFVISGYLITTIILSEKEKGVFSLVNFYERRLRRIIPALFLVMLLSIIFSWFWLSPSHMKDFSESLIAVSLFSSNILFWQETGYWGVENELKPLLHTWSLAVEEQYYFLFPFFLMLVWHFQKRWIFSSFLMIALVSLCLSHWSAFNYPTSNFFLLSTRGWELAIGAGIAFYFLYRREDHSSLFPNRDFSDLLSWVGLGMIAFSVYFYDDNTPFPSLYALLPTIGTALFIVFSSKETSSGKIIGSKFFVGIGLISYSAYLWHQPIFAFARHRSLVEPSLMLFFILSIISLLLAYLSWKYLEAPFRKPGVFTRKQIFSFTAIGSLAFIIFGLIGYQSEGYKFRIDKSFVAIVAQAEKKSFSDDLCVQHSSLSEGDDEYCVLVPKQGKIAFLYGDSHALALMNEAQKAFSKIDYGLVSSSTNGCPPIKDIYRADSPDKEACFEKNEKVYESIVNSPLVEYVILSARWTLGMEGVRFDNKEGGVEQGRKPHLDIVKRGKFLMHKDYSHRVLIEETYIDSIRYFLDAGKKVILVYPVPEAGWNVPDYMSRLYFLRRDSVFDKATASTNHQVFIERNKRTVDALNKIGKNENLYRIFPEDILCDSILSKRCVTHMDRTILYRDDDHLSDAGAKLVVDQIIKYLK